MRAAIYARYSTENQREASIEDQVRLCTARSAAEGWTVVGTYTDHALSGANHLRPGYQQLLADARAGAFDVVVAEALDRLSRARSMSPASTSSSASAPSRSSPSPRARSASSMSGSRAR